MKRLHDYRSIVGDDTIVDIYQKARKLYGKKIIHINATYTGGGVSEILGSLVPLMNDAGVNADWRIVRGTPDFFGITKKFHNGMQGEHINLSHLKKTLYLDANEDFATYAIVDHDCVIIHDPQPLPLVQFCKKQQPWVWRCHVDITTPDAELWDFLKGFILRYDKMIISHEKYRKPDFPVEQRIFHPIIDPLSPKNMVLSREEIAAILGKFHVKTDKPLITQVSRFDKWKDPVGVIEIFKMVKEVVDCRLVLCGSMASDDPEGVQIYERTKAFADRLIAKDDIVLITSENHILVNALQRASAVIIQKSIREGFGLTVTEALWKGVPVVASNVGGIPLQVIDGETGFLVEPDDTEGFARRIVEILRAGNDVGEMAVKAREHVRRNFLITRLLQDYLGLIGELL